MQHLYEYAVIRLVPRVEREEFINVGVILYCAGQGFLGIKWHLDEGRIQALFDSMDIEDVRARLEAFEKVCGGGKEAGPIGLLAPAARFRWLTANRSTIVQTSAAHGGFGGDVEGELRWLYGNLIIHLRPC